MSKLNLELVMVVFRPNMGLGMVAFRPNMGLGLVAFRPNQVVGLGAYPNSSWLVWLCALGKAVSSSCVAQV